MKKKKELLDTLRLELTCPGCDKLYNNSYLLPCEHSLCGSCLSKETKHVKGGHIFVKCPLCKENFCFNQEDEVKFPENYLLNSTVKRYRQEDADSIKKKKRKPKGSMNHQQKQIFCQLCDEKNNYIAMKKCVNCNLNFCEKCLQKIHKNKAFLSHVLIDPSSSTEDQIKCFFHPFSNLKDYCVQDKLPICDECKLSTHWNHCFYSLDLAFQCEMAEMQKNISQFTEVKANFENCIEQLKLMKTDMEQNVMHQNAEVTKEFISLHEGLKLQEQTIKEMIKSETTKKQREVDKFIDSASMLMLKLEGLMLYAVEACKENKPLIFLQTSAQINKRLTEIMLCMIPNNSLAKIPFKDLELNVDHIKVAIDALPSQLNKTESNSLRGEDFQMVPSWNVAYKMRKVKSPGSVKEPLCPSFTSKVQAALVTPNLDLCSCISRSFAVNFNSDASNVDSHADVSTSLQRSPKYATEDNFSVCLAETALDGHISPENAKSASNTETTSNTTDESSHSNTNSSRSHEKFAINLDEASHASGLDCCELATNSDHHIPQHSNEAQAGTNCTLSRTNSCESAASTSSVFQCACFENHEFKNPISTFHNPVEVDHGNNVLNIPTEKECNDNKQKSNQSLMLPEKTKSMYISEKTWSIPIRQYKQQDCHCRHSSGDAFSIELSHTSNDVCSPESENVKYPNDHKSGGLSKDHTISEQVADPDIGMNSSYNSSCLSSERETECVASVYRFCVPCTFDSAGPAQANCANSRSDNLFNGKKDIPFNICTNNTASQGEEPYCACKTFLCATPHGATGNNVSCKDMNWTSEKKGSEIISDGSQQHQLISAAGCKIDCNKQEMHCLLETTPFKAEHACFDEADHSNPLICSTNSVCRIARSRSKFGSWPSFRNAKLLSKNKTFMRSNMQFIPSNFCRSRTTINFDGNSNTLDKDFRKNSVVYLPGTPDDSSKCHSSTHFYSTDLPKSQTFRNIHRTCSQLRPRNSMHRIARNHKNQQCLCTLEKNISMNQGSRNLPSFFQMHDTALACDSRKLQLLDNHLQLDSKNYESTNASAKLHGSSLLKEPMSTLNELPGAPKIYKHTVAGTSAKVKWMCPPMRKRTTYFFELQFQEIISINKEMAIPQDQAGVFSGIRHKNFVATNLNSNSEYLFRVRAVNMIGKGPWSQPYKILTVCGTVQHGVNTKDKSVSLKGVERFYINGTFYQPDGPVFLMIGGEGTANPAWMDHGAWITFAKKLGALCLLIEHRFYGKSQPTMDLSLSNLQYLRSDQALADLAHFRAMVDIKMNLTLNKWIAFGGSYPGSLAAWFRLKYPHLVYAAVASSAPLQAVINFSEYLEEVTYSLESSSAPCPLLVKDASDTLTEFLSKADKYSQVTQDFQLCEPLEIKSGMDSAYLLETLAGNFMDVVQYNKDNRVFEDPKGTNITIDMLCTIMENSSLGIPYQRYAKVSQLLLDTDEVKCLDASYRKFLSDMMNTSWAAPAADGSRQWAYQSCTEFGYYQSTQSLLQPFSGFPLSYKLQQCIDLFGPAFNHTVVAEAVQHTNENYGGLNIKGSRIVFPNGSKDPWHILSITKGHKAIYIQGSAHCADMYPEQASDPPQLRKAREEIFRRLKRWVKQ